MIQGRPDIVRHGKLVRPVEVEFMKGKGTTAGGVLIHVAGESNKKPLGWIRKSGGGKYLLKIYSAQFKHGGNLKIKAPNESKAFDSLPAAQKFAKDVLKGKKPLKEESNKSLKEESNKSLKEGRPAPDLGMPSQAGNNLLFALVRKAETERELLSMIDKLALKLRGKYKDAKDELITRAAIDAFQNKGVSASQRVTDKNIMQQIKSVEDLDGGEIVLNDKSKIKMDKGTATKVLKNLMSVKPQQRGQVMKTMQKDKKGFNRFLKILNR